MRGMKRFEFPNIEFFKLQGSGNDFVIIIKDDLKLSPDEMSDWAKKICKRCFGVGADGLIFVERDESYPYRWHFYNSDGSRAEMCGNGSRCVAWLCYMLDIAEKEHSFYTDAGPIKAKIFPEEEMVEVQLTSFKRLKLNFEIKVSDRSINVSFVQVGVPHVVVFVEDIKSVDVNKVGREIRFHPFFSPEGTNVNFVEVKKDHLLVRTYERGVEKETYACGTGASASVLIANKLGLCDAEQTKVITSGGEELFITLRGEDLFLKGKVTFVYKGELNLKGIGLWEKRY